MSLKARYLQAVGAYLPEKTREDILSELDSLIDDELQDRQQEAGADEATVADVLRELGSPEEVAVRYSPKPPYVIGPEQYFAFLRTLRLIAIGLGVFYVVVWSWRIYSGSLSAPGVIQQLFPLAKDYLYNFLALMGLSVVVFFLFGDEGQTRAGEWEPRKLPPLQTAETVNRPSWALGLVFLAVLLVFLNVYLDRLTILFFSGGEKAWIPLVATGLAAEIPLINLWAALYMALGVAVLWRGQWSPALRWTTLTLDLFFLVILARLVLAPSLFDLEQFRQEASALAWIDDPGRMAEMAGNVARGVVVMVLLISLVDFLVKVVKLRAPSKA